MEDTQLTVVQHLAELRARLLRTLLAILALGTLSLLYARELFEFLMRPVLAALPEESRSLIYTSGIEELNVLLKVGLYAGVFLATPVALFQLWKFVAPGLLRNERRMLLPFVSLGTLFFTLGAAFCYLAVLPSMFSFLLEPTTPLLAQEGIELARAKSADAGRLWLLGETARAEDLARQAGSLLEQAGLSKDAAERPASKRELDGRFSHFEFLLDAAVLRAAHHPAPPSELRAAIELHGQARALAASGRLDEASQKLEESRRLLAGPPPEGAALALIWRAQKQLVAAEATLAAASWTRPMLSMREQLSLVLVLEIAFGLIFELPLVMGALALLGALRFRWVQRFHRYALVGCVALAALITPTGDAINLALMAGPMMICFEIGVVLVWFFERRRKAVEQTAEESDNALEKAQR